MVTLGKEGAGAETLHERAVVKAPEVSALDTTGAGDTFLGYLVAELADERPLGHALELACRAAALAVTRPGAMDAIPTRMEVLAMADTP